MNWKDLLIELLGLDSGASDEDIAAALKKKVGGDVDETALQSALAPIAKAVGLAENSDAAAVLAGVQALAEGDDNQTVVALQGEISALATQLNALTGNASKKAAAAFVDGAIKAGHVGVKPMRDRYISLHMKDPEGTEALIGALPVLHGTRLVGEPAKDGGDGSVGEADLQVIALMGRDPEEYKKSLAGSAGKTEVL